MIAYLFSGRDCIGAIFGIKHGKKINKKNSIFSSGRSWYSLFLLLANREDHMTIWFVVLMFFLRSAHWSTSAISLRGIDVQTTTALKSLILLSSSNNLIYISLCRLQLYCTHICGYLNGLIANEGWTSVLFVYFVISLCWAASEKTNTEIYSSLRSFIFKLVF